jgi:hypothetical protein
MFCHLSTGPQQIICIRHVGSFIHLKSHVPKPRKVVLSAEPASGSYGSDKHKTRLSKRKTASEVLFSVREELFSGEFEG